MNLPFITFNKIYLNKYQMTSIIEFNDGISYLRRTLLENILELDIKAFKEQRNLDKTRVNKIKKDLLKKLNSKHDYLLTSPLVLIKSKGNILLDCFNNRTNLCIVDGQHRLEALKEIHKTYPKIKNIGVPIFVHYADSLNTAEEIQYDLMKQKPFNKIDQIRKSEYSLENEFGIFADKLNRKYHKYIKYNLSAKSKKVIGENI